MTKAPDNRSFYNKRFVTLKFILQNWSRTRRFCLHLDF
jgi:hypothetical protein